MRLKLWKAETIWSMRKIAGVIPYATARKCRSVPLAHQKPISLDYLATTYVRL